MHRERLELALDAAGLGYYEWDVVRDVVFVSPKAAQLTGAEEGELAA